MINEDPTGTTFFYQQHIPEGSIIINDKRTNVPRFIEKNNPAMLSKPSVSIT